MTSSFEQNGLGELLAFHDAWKPRMEQAGVHHSFNAQFRSVSFRSGAKWLGVSVCWGGFRAIYGEDTDDSVQVTYADTLDAVLRTIKQKAEDETKVRVESQD